jgi:hypothetical protein
VTLDDIPFGDPKALEAWVRKNETEVTPVILGRLLGHNRFVELCVVPSTSSVIRVEYGPFGIPRFPVLANLTFAVYNSERVAPTNVRTALGYIEALRVWLVKYPNNAQILDDLWRNR